MKVPPEIASLSPYQPGKPISETKREYGLTHVYKLAVTNRHWAEPARDCGRASCGSELASLSRWRLL